MSDPTRSDEAEVDRVLRPRRALWVVPVADLGGVARHVLDVTRVGIPGWQLAVLCPEGPLADRLRAQGASVTTGAFGTSAGVLASRRTLAAVANALRPDIVHSHLAYADIVHAWTRLPRGTRRITTEHGIAGDDAVYHTSRIQSRVMTLVHRMRFPRFDGAIAVAEATRAVMIKKWRVRQPIVVIPNGVDCEVRRAGSSRSNRGLHVVSLSRLAPEKRINLLLDAFALVVSEDPRAILTIAGDGPLRARLIEHSSRLGLSDNVRFVGHVDAQEVLAGADAVAQLSVWENCSYTLLDAVANGLRVVATDVGGNREILGVKNVVSADPATVARALVEVTPPQYPAPTTVSSMCGSIAREYREAMEGKR